MILLSLLIHPGYAQDAGPPDAEVAAVASNAHALRLFHLVRQGTEGNFCFSPYSSHQIAVLLAEGAGGDTLAELTALAHLPKDEALRGKLTQALKVELSRAVQTKGIQLGVANSLWSPPSLPFASAFVNVAATRYGAHAEMLPEGNPVQSSAVINTWVRNKTQGKITNLVGPADFSRDAPNVVLVNAVYLKSFWENPFDPRLTKPRAFSLPDKSSTMLDTMTKTEHCDYAEGQGWQCLSMPFKSGQVSFTVLLPKDDLARKQLETGLTLDAWMTMRDGMNKTEAEVFLPRINFNTKMELLPMWEALGVKEIMTTKADFKKMIPSKPSLISNVIQSATVELDEIGVVAAAATGGIPAPFADSVPEPTKPKRIIFRADRPFLWFIIHEQTGLMLFCGRFAGR